MEMAPAPSDGDGGFPAGRHARGLLIGRFQPFHLGHLHAVRHALSKVDHLLIGIGSSNRSMEQDNPFTAEERREMIQGSLESQIRKRTSIHMIPDLHNHKRWVEMIQERLPAFEVVFTNDPVTRSLYLQRGTRVYGIPFLDRPALSGTAIRSGMRSGRPWAHLVPPGTARTIRQLGNRMGRVGGGHGDKPPDNTAHHTHPPNYK